MSIHVYLKSIGYYHSQFKESWNGSNRIKMPKNFQGVSEVIIAGMGGSSFGVRVVTSAFSDELVLPIHLVEGYDLPEYADETTLVLVTSYSGNTEETVSILEQARVKGCKIFAITSGGKLKNAVDSGNIPGYIFDTNYNPSGSPRTGIGYIVGSTLGVLTSLKFLEFSQQKAMRTASFIKHFTELLSRSSDMIFKISSKIDGYSPIFIASEHLVSASYVIRNFMNETSKNIGFTYDIPSMNHHFLDGLDFPNDINKKYIFVYLISSLYNERNKKRFEIMRGITKEKGINDIAITLGAKDKLDEIWEAIIIGSLVSYNLAVAHKVDPRTNEMVDLLKRELG
ncbi:hypothetical protein CO058_03095 [candidate division WWE3 bacterium CG_4_9_14_0_2_um_filter_35_11]|uniref:SIS domain-containing protein n=1 Tax=candidate division WWE3 bacterium CG_4_9_14_0_2_um_filter_35_11 TaxID=1975077 RepID=A0A2M8ELC0_UNCKA|nr:MAG: hypothetical protein COV25_01480 [candidate division WWE3 bacterium CG10_big_fil_rev_8_21_14_0_10_35_32]PJC23515.1 MAG: hypothetical protein CO058_03095 [candidate division WWE3 bacterium CG_4_9_14_0_2_um_filter_35_11]